MTKQMNHGSPIEADQIDRDGQPLALTILQWTLGLVILGESARFAYSSPAAQAFARTGMPNFVHPALAWAEIAAAILFLMPWATRLAARFLIAVLAAALVIHLLHGWFDVGALFVYAAAAWTVAAGKRTATNQRERA
jgi:hypothetical protein